MASLKYFHFKDFLFASTYVLYFCQFISSSEKLAKKLINDNMQEELSPNSCEQRL